MMLESSYSVGVVLVTYKSKKHFTCCLPPLIDSGVKILIVDAESCDGSKELAQSLNIQFEEIPYNSYNHGLTREWGRKKLGTDIVIMMTPDAYLKEPSSIEKLIKPLVNGEASLSYGRQLPHKNARFFESFARSFNYGEVSQIRSLQDKNRYGSYLYFFSDSFAAYKSSALDEVGGFPEVLVGEDTVIAAKLINRGHKIAYVAESEVYHSHGYSLKKEFQRHFDTGLSRKKFASLLHAAGTDSVRGKNYAKSLLFSLWHNDPLKIPYGFLHIGAKWLGYQMGWRMNRAPLWLKKALSSQKFYWEKNVTH